MLAPRPRPRCGRAAIAVAVLATLALGAAATPAAGAISRGEASAIARDVLSPGRERGIGGKVVVFASRIPLRAGAVVSGSYTDRRRIRLRRRAWLVWEDLGHGLLFPHPSKLLLIDARTGRILVKRHMTSFPRVGGRPARFLRSGRAYLRAPDAVYKRVRASAGPGDFKDEGIVVLGPRDDPAFKSDFEPVSKFAEDMKIDIEKPDGGYTELQKAVDSLVKKGKKDIALFLAGHGFPEKDQYYTDEKGQKQLSAPGSAKPKMETDGKLHQTISGTQLEDLFKRFPNTKFKVIISSCYGGRFEPHLKASPNVLVGVMSAPTNTVSGVGLWRALVAGLRDWAKTAEGVPEVADGIRRAFEGDAVKRWSDALKDAVPGFRPTITPRPAPPGKTLGALFEWRFLPLDFEEVEGSGQFRVESGGVPAFADAESPLDAIAVVLPPDGPNPRAITDHACPRQLPLGSVATSANHNDTLFCTGGSLPVEQRFTLNVRMTPPPDPGMGGQLYGRQDGQPKGPFPITGP